MQFALDRRAGQDLLDLLAMLVTPGASDSGTYWSSASIRISLEKAQGWPARTRRSSPARSRTLGSFLATILYLSQTMLFLSP